MAQSTVCVTAHTFPLIITDFQMALLRKEMPTSFLRLQKQAPRLVRKSYTQIYARRWTDWSVFMCMCACKTGRKSWRKKI